MVDDDGSKTRVVVVAGKALMEIAARCPQVSWVAMMPASLMVGERGTQYLKGRLVTKNDVDVWPGSDAY